MKFILSIKTFFIILAAIPVLLAGCGTFEVGIEPVISPTTTPEGSQIDQDLPPSEIAPPPSEIPPTGTTPPPATSNVPDLVTIANLTPFASPDIRVLMLKDDQLSVEPTPVEYGILWDYSPLSGMLAYSSEFFHTSVSKNLAVSDLWVYDYQNGTAQKWLDDNVTHAAWAPDGEHITAAVFNPDTEQTDLVLLSGPDHVELLAECASTVFSWSPDGNILAYINARLWLNLGVDESCLGTYLVTFPNGISGGEWELSRVSDFKGLEFGGTHEGDRPLWALDQNALIYPDAPFWVVPLDGSPAFIPQTPAGEEPMNLPRPFGSLWSSQLNQLVGNVESGPASHPSFGGVWVYQLSEDLSQIDSYFRIGDVPQGDNSSITLVDWWVPGESILILDGDNLDTSQYLSEVGRGPAVWSLLGNQWIEMHKD